MFFSTDIVLISRRITLGGRNRVAAIVACSGVACAVIVMLLTLSISLGFKSQIRGKLAGFNPQIVIQPPYDYLTGTQAEFLDTSSDVESIVSETLKGINISSAIYQPGIIKTDDDYAAMIFTGFDNRHDDTFERSNIVRGHWPVYCSADSAYDRIVLSDNIASRLRVDVGDRVTACFFINDDIRSRRYTIAGIYTSNFGDYDATVCYASFNALRDLVAKDSAIVSAIHIDGVEDKDISAAAQTLQEAYLIQAQTEGRSVVPVVDNVTHTGAIYLNWLELLDANVIVIFILMCCVSACTIVSALFMIILNNIRTIGILRSLGMSRRKIGTVFVIVTMRVVGLGILAGNIIALGMAAAQHYWNLIPLDPEMYYLTYVPVCFDWAGFIAVDIGVAIFAWLVLVLPARIASRINPSSVMRYD